MMHTVEVSNLSKSFGALRAVADVSFSVAPGEIFGLLGPNGAGKTTTIRLMLDILKPDRGTVSILGGSMTEPKKDRIGYMPEERGLYQEMEVEQCLVYLGTLKGVPPVVARRRAGEYLERFDLAPYRRKKVKELSRGMQQKAQIINTVLPDPELVIVDEPFSGLDPVNTQLVKELLRNLREQGKTIIMSSHMMQQVEELCDRIVLINKGRNILYGPLGQIQRDYSGHAVMVKVHGDLPALSGVQTAAPRNGGQQLTLTDAATPLQILEQLVSHQVEVEQFEIAVPTLDEIFIRVVKEDAMQAGGER